MNKHRIKNGRYTHKPNWRKRLHRIGVILVAVLLVADILMINHLYSELIKANTYEVSNVSAEEQPELSIYDQICLASGGENCDVLYNLAKCESSLNPDAIHINTNRTFDAGLYQWNSIHINSGKISLSCALDVVCSTQATNREIREGNLNWWVCSNKI